MAINYSLYANHLTNSEDYMAVVQNQKTKTLDELIDRMIGRGSTVTKAEALAVLEEYQASVQEALEEGYSISTPLLRISPSIQGVFTDPQDNFDRSRHILRLNVTSGSRISQISNVLKVEKVTAKAPQPTPVDFTDVKTTSNETLSPGGVGVLTGSRLKVNQEDTQQGIFIIGADGTETRVTTYIRNMPSNLIFMIPDTLTAGIYQIDIRTIFQKSKTIRSGTLSTDLTVQ
ncbi:DNA-binding domain-containing protein [Reichenbachiella sp. MSK19-1]|uniref:HU family DNA-binding protein n=1 Tax=Reichenbachiella sp. MSK19-1 TaxID=1897631 RepID=UPI000E6C762D|nr:DNA-binding domain-containing protein [Reichenbachiella sp. MSK19-1]RJE74718.1 hypothetical protein BGP76_16425 [Reichenbachiella sp. MSK19-1]